MRALAEEQRPEPRAEERAQPRSRPVTARLRSGPGVPPQRHQHRENDDDPVQAGQGGRRPARARVVDYPSPSRPADPPRAPVKCIPRARRRRITHRALPAFGALALLSLGAGIWSGASVDYRHGAHRARFDQAWERGDYGAMYGLLRRRSGAPTRSPSSAPPTATPRPPRPPSVSTRRPGRGRRRHRVGAGGADTRVFGTCAASSSVPVSTVSR